MPNMLGGFFRSILRFFFPLCYPIINEQKNKKKRFQRIRHVKRRIFMDDVVTITQIMSYGRSIRLNIWRSLYRRVSLDILFVCHVCISTIFLCLLTYHTRISGRMNIYTNNNNKKGGVTKETQHPYNMNRPAQI